MSDDVEMHDGVKLLLKRIKSHPEEFDGIGEGFEGYTMPGKWGAVIMRFWKVLTEQEQTALFTALRAANRENFHHTVMRTIMEDKSKQEAYEYEQIMKNPVVARHPTPTQMTLPGIMSTTEFAAVTSARSLFDTNK